MIMIKLIISNYLNINHYIHCLALLCKASFVDVELKSEDHTYYYHLDDFTEASLTEHEHQVVSLKNYYEENKEMDYSSLAINMDHWNLHRRSSGSHI